MHLFARSAFWLRSEHESRDQQRCTKKGCSAVKGKVKAADLKGAGACCPVKCATGGESRENGQADRRPHLLRGVEDAGRQTGVWRFNAVRGDQGDRKESQTKAEAQGQHADKHVRGVMTVEWNSRKNEQADEANGNADMSDGARTEPRDGFAGNRRAADDSRRERQQGQSAAERGKPK